ncbi:MAG TPA: PPC domain-containing protein [Lachnospiraceae bacterium]|nr:PPC domain-containing protein [Lachnospiraceae bacterium]
MKLLKKWKMKTLFGKGVIAFAIILTATFVSTYHVKAEQGSIIDVSTQGVVTELKPHVVTTGSSSDLGKISQYMFSMTSDLTELIVPLKASVAGVLQYNFSEESESVDVEFYSDKACTKQMDYNRYNGYAQIPKAGTYYVKFVNSYGEFGAEDIVDLTGEFDCQIYPSETGTLKMGTWKSTGVWDETKANYYKVVVTKTGTLQVEINAQNTGTYLTLCNSSKKAITDEISSSTISDTKLFALKKGTYYLKVTTNSFWLRMKTTQDAVTDQSGSSKSKAAKLTLGKDKTGLIFLEDKTSKYDWFKFTLTKTTSVDLQISGSCSAGYIYYELSSSSIDGTLSGYLSGVGSYEDTPLNYYTSDGKVHTSLPKGTYYIKVYKESAKSCGTYFVKAKKR